MIGKAGRQSEIGQGASHRKGIARDERGGTATGKGHYRDRNAVTGIDWITVRVTPPKTSSRSHEWL